jgi:hypothetical protein
MVASSKKEFLSINWKGFWDYFSMIVHHNQRILVWRHSRTADPRAGSQLRNTLIMEDAMYFGRWIPTCQRNLMPLFFFASVPLPWRWRHQVSLRGWCLSHNFHGVMYQNIVISEFGIMNLSNFNLITFAVRWFLILRSDYKPLSIYCSQFSRHITSFTLGRRKEDIPYNLFERVKVTFRIWVLLDSKNSVTRSHVAR